MTPEILERLRLQGYTPRTMLDVGAHVGTFTAMFLQAFPHCRPTLIEPNPYCEEALAQFPFERHMVAASSENGEAELFLTREWLQSTGSSLYRENSAFFRDEVVLRQPVRKARLDDLLAGRSFDFVKIDTQGSELDVLKGGAEVLRRADYVLVEVSTADYNPGAGRAEEVFAALAAMGFVCGEAIEVFRYNGELDGRIMQIDYLFEAQVKRPCQGLRLGPFGDRAPVAGHLAARKAQNSNFTVLQLGGAADAWPGGLADAVAGAPGGAAPLDFGADLAAPGVWEAMLQHVARNGRFSYCVCDHLLQRLDDPGAVLRRLPLIADAGLVTTPSRYLESLRPQGPYRGFVNHRWVFDRDGERLVLAPKAGLFEHLALAQEGEWAQRQEAFELSFSWRGAIEFEILSPPAGGEAMAYAEFFSRP